jgi:hypothetical protein
MKSQLVLSLKYSLFSLIAWEAILIVFTVLPYLSEPGEAFGSEFIILVVAPAIAFIETLINFVFRLIYPHGS